MVLTNAFHLTNLFSFLRSHMFPPVVQLHRSTCKPHTTHSSLIRLDEGLTLEKPAFNFFTVANLPHQLFPTINRI